MVNSYDYYYWSSTVKRDASRFYLASEIPQFGFHSLYGVTREVAEKLKEVGVAGYTGPVWSKTLALDCDQGEAGRRTADRLLISLGLGFTVYKSGNKGFHYYIDREVAPSADLPQQDKEFVKGFSNAHPDLFDLSIYTHLHLFRAIGGKHEKTGERKQRLYTVKGNELHFEEDALPKEELNSHWITNYQSIFDSPYINSLITPSVEGDRHRHLVKLCYALRNHGTPMEAALWLVEEVSKLAEIPKEEWEVQKLVSSIYR